MIRRRENNHFWQNYFSKSWSKNPMTQIAKRIRAHLVRGMTIPSGKGIAIL
jgi:hypothetical protein